MVLLELGTKISDALKRLNDSTVVDDNAVDEMLRDIGNALIGADVSVRLVVELRTKIKTRIHLEGTATGIDKRKLIKQVYWIPFSLFFLSLSLSFSFSFSLSHS